jgi:hypothetical protein
MKLWVMGYKRVMGYGPKSPAYQLGNFKNLWGIREYGLSELWVKRASTVAGRGWRWRVITFIEKLIVALSEI